MSDLFPSPHRIALKLFLDDDQPGPPPIREWLPRERVSLVDTLDAGPYVYF